MISKAKASYIKSLQVKKYRKQEQCFLVEGAKGVTELLNSSFDTTMVLGTTGFLDIHEQLLRRSKAEILEVTPGDLEALGTFQTNDAAMAVAKMKGDKAPDLKKNEVVLALDDIRDPGNLGTIIRTADWYGIATIIASPETADFYNPKVITATMGSFCRVTVHYTSLPEFIRGSKLPVFGTFLDGEDVHKMNFPEGCILVIGNESHGISDEVAAVVKNHITIPRIGGAESLNAAVATAVVLDNLRRRN